LLKIERHAMMILTFMSSVRKMLTPGALRSRISIRPREFAALTGTPLPTVYRRIADQQIRATRIGATWHIPVSAIQALLGAGN
jgi:excisionase family DNA binding protein